MINARARKPGVMLVKGGLQMRASKAVPFVLKVRVHARERHEGTGGVRG